MPSTLASLPSTQAAPPPALMSPVTPGANLHQLTTVPLPVSTSIVSSKSDSRNTALPSPVSSAGSRPSPVAENHLLTTGAAASTAALAAPSPPGSNTPITQPTTEAECEISDTAISTTSRQSETVQGAARNPPLVTAVHSNVHVPSEPRPTTNPHCVQVQSLNVALPTEERWVSWERSCEDFQTSRNSTSLVTEGRLQLLRDACRSRDILFLLAHQIYYRSFGAAQVLSDLPIFHEKNCEIGLRTLRDLLQDNGKLPFTMVLRFAEFPEKPQILMQEPWYHQQVKVLAQFLWLLATRFANPRSEFHKVFYSRRYPPLVKELYQHFQIKSPVLMTVIFRSVCRRVYEACHIPKLNELFQKDLFNTHQSTDEHHVPALICAYQQIPMLYTQTTTPRFVFNQQSGFVATSSAPSAPSEPQAQVAPPTTTLPTQAHVLHPSAGNPPSVARSSTAASPSLNRTSAAVSRHAMQSAALSNHNRASQMMPQLSQYALDHYPSQLISTDSPRRTAPPLPYPGQTHQAGQRALFSAPSVSHPSQAYPNSFRRISVINPGQTGAPQSSTYATVPPQTHAPPTTTQGATTLPRPIAPQSSALPVNQNQAPQIPQSPANMPFFPPPSHPTIRIVDPIPMQLGLHQADMRDPVKKLVQRTPNGELWQTELFHYLGGFALEPQIVDPNLFHNTWNFTITSDDCKRFPVFTEPRPGCRPIFTYQTGCRSLRLRCIALGDSEVQMKDSLWPTAPTTWPSVFYVFVNETELYVRRKAYNGKDLPLDITRHLRPGANKLTIHLLLGPNECNDLRYVFGVETMETIDLDCVLRHVRRMPAEITRSNIQKRLNMNSRDEDLSIVTDSLNISLIDPFTARIFEIPARSLNCNHQECFDLNTFIKTRGSESGTTPMNDSWCCPICKVDARPMKLFVDCFLEEIHAEIMRSNKLEGAEAIQIRADGTWSLKITANESPLCGEPSTSLKRKADSMADDTRTKKENSTLAPSADEALVIEID